MPVSRDPRLRLMGQCGRFICVCDVRVCACVGVWGHLLASCSKSNIIP